MLVTACLTNCCGKVKPLSEVFGIIHQPDLFDEENSFKSVAPEKTNIHFCVECYTHSVTDRISSLFSRKHNVQERDKKIKELAYLFKRFVHTRADMENLKKNM